MQLDNCLITIYKLQLAKDFEITFTKRDDLGYTIKDEIIKIIDCHSFFSFLPKYQSQVKYFNFPFEQNTLRGKKAFTGQAARLYLKRLPSKK